MNKSTYSLPYCFLFCLLVFSNNGHAAIAQSPLFLSVTNDPNVLLNMSIETPMGGAAYNDQPDTTTGCAGRVTIGTNQLGSCYSSSQVYLGYFDPDKCYSYVTNTTASRFEPVGSAVNHACDSKFSGNFMNWATMTAMDMFVSTMTGGNRIVDTTAETVIRRTRKQDNDGWFPHKIVSSTYNVAPSTVTPWNNSQIFIHNTDFGVEFGSTYGGADIGTYNVNIKVCMQTTAINKEENCVPYNNSAYFKPEGLIQHNADHMRFGVTSYSNTNTHEMNGGVLRSNIKYVGTLKPNGSGSNIANPNLEINTDGTLNLNPNPDDISASVGTTNTGLTMSGVIPYLNKFSDGGYKSYDPASELFYESIRYFKNLGPTAEFLTGDNGDFPILPKSRWEDPIQQRCQKNFIVGINDANPWEDKRLPGTFFTTSNFNGIDITNDYGQPTTPDSDINVRTLTNAVGDLQGITGTSQCIGCTSASCDLNPTIKTIDHLGEVFGTCPGPGKNNSYYISGLAYYANTQDIRTGSGGTTNFPGKQTISTFMIDTQEYQANPLVGQMNMLWLAGKYGGFVDSNKNNKPDLASEWDSNSDGQPDNYVLASQPKILVDALKQAFENIENQIASFSALSANSTRLDTSTLIYQASFDNKNSAWTGEITAYKLDSTGNFSDIAWKASNKLPTENDRKIFSYNPALTSAKGINFEWANLSNAQKTALDPVAAAASATTSPVLDYIRGDQSNENKEPYSFRRRTTVLGDIVNSDPWYVGNSEDFGYATLPGSEGSNYTNFRFCKRDRTGMLFVGANDGMLHAFNAQTGTEVFSYIPNAVIPSLNKLTSPQYGCNRSGCSPHEFFVDGSPRAGDAYIKVTPTSTPSWRTLLLGSSGAGNSQSIFALDVTYSVQPTSASCPADAKISDPNTTDKVRWEISPTQAPNSTDLIDATNKPGFTNNLGYTMAQPTLARMQGGSWAAIIANGYNSANKKAVLFIVDAATGEIIRSLDTGKGGTSTPNGLSTPIPVDFDSDRIVDYIYAGDLLGNLWKFDVSSTDPSNWSVAFSTGSPAVPAPLFTACSSACDGTNYQPITVKPQVGRNPAGGLMVYFGTGKYFESGDQIVGSSPKIQSFYGLRDTGAVISNKTNLQQQSITAETAVDLNTDGVKDVVLRGTSDTVVDYTGNATTTPPTVAKQGWYMNLVPPTGSAVGERVISTSILRSGRIIFVTLIPSIDPCEAGGSSWFMELDAVNGKRLSNVGFDVDNNGVLNSSDKTLLDTNLDGTTDSSDQTVVVSGKSNLNSDGSSQGIIRGVTILNRDNGKERKYTNDSKNNLDSFEEEPGEIRGRQSWRQVR